MKGKKTELLAPAGNIDCLYAAMNAGADAIYLGLDKFGARANAANFSEEELLKSLDIAHIHNKKIYLTVNTLFKDNEIDELYELLYRPYQNGLDAVIVQDIGVMDHISKVFPCLPIHVSTQAAVTSALAADFLKDFNVKRIVPARELSLEEIKKLIKMTGLEVECFIHGSMCYSYSGKCLLSSFIGGRSGNRGRCAQPCRLMYDETYPLSLKDMCTVDMISELIEAGIASFKIEGRMKSPDYVYAVTSVYRKYIDSYSDNGKCNVKSGDRERLISGYTRSGSCSGYYNVHNGRDMITPEKPSYETGQTMENIQTITDMPSVSIKMSCELHVNEPARIRVSGDEFSLETITDIVPDKAQNQALSRDGIIKQLQKSGGTGFVIGDIELDADDDLFIPKSSLNAIRRLGLDAYREELLRSKRRTSEDISEDNTCKHEIKHDLQNEPNEDRVLVNVSVLTRQQLDVAFSSGADGVIVPMSLFAGECMNGSFDPKGKSIYIALPYVIREEGLQNDSVAVSDFISDCTKRYEISGFYVSNLESLQILKDSGYGGPVIGDIHMYAYNRRAYERYKIHGIDRTAVPVELNTHELIRRGIKGEELMIYGRIPVMISANCVKKTLDKCQKSNGHSLYLTDRKCEKLFVHCNCSECTNVIYNSVKLSISDEDSLFEMIKPSGVRLSFTDESPDDMRIVLDRYFANKNSNGSTGVKLIEKYTKGHIKRGVD